MTEYITEMQTLYATARPMHVFQGTSIHPTQAAA